MISVIAILFFFYIVLNMFTVQFRMAKRNPWKTYPTRIRPSISRKAAAQKRAGITKVFPGLFIFDAPVP